MPLWCLGIEVIGMQQDHESVNTVDLALESGADPVAQDLLVAQRRLTEAQIRQMRLQIHNDRVSLMLRLAIGAGGLAILVAALLWLWDAAHDRSLVVEPFSTPADMAAGGLTGDVAAARVLDRLVGLQRATVSLRGGDSYADDWNDDLSVEIADTGISLSQVDRFARNWLGDRTRISGAVYRTASGVTVAARAGTSPAVTVSGAEADIETLIGQAAEAIYAQTQPFRYANHLRNQGRTAEAADAFRRIAASADARERAWAEGGLSYSLLLMGDAAGAEAAGRRAVATASDLPVGWLNLAAAQFGQGDTEAFLASNRAALARLKRSKDAGIAPEVAGALVPSLQENIAADLGDFRAAARHAAETERLSRGLTIVGSEAPYLRAADLAAAGDVAEARALLASLPNNSDLALATDRYMWLPRLPGVVLAEASGDWDAARPQLQAAVDQLEATSALGRVRSRVYLRPWLAYAYARTGDLQGARALLAGASPRCQLCARMEGRILALAGDTAGSDRAFARAVRLAPSSPFAAADWAEARLARGDLEGAIAQARAAHAAGPAYPRPLRLWAEALGRQGRASAAAAKLREAERLQRP
jgi:tetratricopeptide (TPR) repeat protein